MSIVINNSKNVFLLQTVSNSYAFGIDDQGLVISRQLPKLRQSVFHLRKLQQKKNLLKESDIMEIISG